MKIVLLGEFKPSYRTENWILKSLDAEVITLDVNTKDEKIIKFLEITRPDVLLHSKTNGVIGDFANVQAWCEENRVMTVCWLFDLYAGTPRAYEVWTNPMFQSDIVVTTDGGSEELFKKYKINHHVIRQGILEEEAYMEEREKKNDVIFIGSNNHWWIYRKKLISFLEGTYGARFTHIGYNKPVRGRALNRLLAETKIVVGDTVYSKNYWSNRIYEVLGRGGFLVHPRIEGLEKEFEYFKHFVPYDYKDFEQLKRIIDYYLKDDKRREKIRRAGHEFCKQNYTYKIRCNSLLKLINEQKRLLKKFN